MKNLFFVALLVALSVIKATGQVGPVFPYTSPSKEALKSLAKQETAKGETYRNYLVKTINIGLRDTTLKVDGRYIDYIFNHIYLEEVNLEDSKFKNSGYDPSTDKMHPSVGHKIGWGFQWIFRVGTFTIVIIKGDCGNILEVPVIRTRTERSSPDIITDSKSSQQSETGSHNVTDYGKSKPKLGNLNPTLKKNEEEIDEGRSFKEWLKDNKKAIIKTVVGSALITGGYFVYENNNKGGSSSEPIVVIPPPKKDGSPVDAQPQGRLRTPLFFWEQGLP